MSAQRMPLSLALCLAATTATLAQTTRPSEGEFTCYFGALHSHTALSPDFRPKAKRTPLITLLAGNSDDRFTLKNGPMAAWKRAADKAKLDFLALTDHLHGPSGVQALALCSHEMPPGGYRLLTEAADKINADAQYAGRFLAIPGMEWSTLGSGNHVNIFFAEHQVPDDIDNGDFRKLAEGFLEHADFEKDNPLVLVQMNHPNGNHAARKENYGRDEFANGAAGDQAFVAAFKDHYVAIEHINNSDLGNKNTHQRNDHRDGDSLDSHFRYYLNLGFRLAPTAGHDNHRPNWGRHTAARTGVWAKELTPQSWVEAMRARRAFATEDNEMAVIFKCGGKWMGSTVEIDPAGETVTFTVRVEQFKDTFHNVLQDEGPYAIELIGDLDGVGGLKAKSVSFTHGGQTKSTLDVPQGDAVQFSREVTPGQYFYVHVTETNDQDGSGNDADAWTAPIWFESP